MSFPLPLRIAQKLPIRNSWKLIIKKLPIPLPILYYFELIREVLANTGYERKSGQTITTRQTPQFCSHILVHIFALYVGVGVSKCFPSAIFVSECLLLLKQAELMFELAGSFRRVRRQNPGAFLGAAKETKTPFLAPFGPTF